MGIIGRPFESFINDQVKTRQEALGEGTGLSTGGDLIKLKTREAFMTSTPFIRLASSVNVSSDAEIEADAKASREASIKARGKAISAGLNLAGAAEAAIANATIDDAAATAQATSEYDQQIGPIPGKSIAQQIRENGLLDNTPESEWIGSGLSQKCILLGVPSSYTRDDNGNYKQTPIAGALGVSGAPFGTTPNQFSSAYGWGYNRNGILNGRGYVPPPGITSVDFEYKNDGALAQATINIKAFSPEQFSIIDILYMRPGFTVLLEFGHSVYLDNKGKITHLDTSSTGPFDYLFDQSDSTSSTKPTYSQMAKLIREEKKNKNGNYEGFFGRITKFSWKFSNDGSYNITIKLTGTGDVINSLNASIPKLSGTPRSFLSGKQSNTYNSKYQTEPNNKQIYKGNYNNSGDSKYDNDEAEEEGDFIISDAFESQLNYELYSIFNDGVAFKGNGFSNQAAAASNMVLYDIPILGKKYTKDFRFCVLKYDVADSGGTEYSPITLVKFGALLSMIQKICNVTDGKDNTLIQFEMVRNIFCKEIGADEGNDLYPANTQNIFKEDETYMATFPGNLSADPNICLKDVSNGHEEICGKRYYSIVRYINKGGKAPFKGTRVTSVMNDNFYLRADDNNKLINPSLAYRLSQVWININFVTKLLKDLRSKDEDEKQTVPLLSLIQGILTGVNEACGGINNFRVIFDEETAEVKILSESPALTAKSQDGGYTTINTYGFDKSFDGKKNVGSFITNLDLNSELSDKMATQMTIGAASNNNTFTAEGSAFSSYSKGLKDMLFVDKISSLQKITGNKAKSTSELLDEIVNEAEFSEAVRKVYNAGEFDEDNFITTLKQVNTQIAPKILDQYFAKKMAPSPAFLPFNMSLTMHGLGGIRIYDAFKIDGKVLPLSYNPVDIKLIIKSLSHNISLDGWKTSISTLSTPDNEANYLPTPPIGEGAAVGSTYTSSGEPGIKKSFNSANCEILMVDGFDTPATYGGKAIKPPSQYKSVYANKYIKKDIIPILESSSWKKAYTKGARMLALAYAIKEGYKPGSRSYITKNPGNIGNTDSGANVTLNSLKAGTRKLIRYFKDRSTGKAPGFRFGTQTIPQYYSNEIGGNQRNYQRPDGCLPGYTGDFQGQIGFFVKKYATFARVNNNGITGIATIFKLNGYPGKIDGNTTLKELMAFNPSGKIKLS